MRVTSKGQVTIPQGIRETAGFAPGTEVEFFVDEAGTVRLRRRPEQPENAALTAAIRNLRGRADRRMSTEEIMTLTRG